MSLKENNPWFVERNVYEITLGALAVCFHGVSASGCTPSGETRAGFSLGAARGVGSSTWRGGRLVQITRHQTARDPGGDSWHMPQLTVGHRAPPGLGQLVSGDP